MIRSLCPGRPRKQLRIVSASEDPTNRPEERIRASKEYDRILENGRRTVGRQVILFTLANDLDHPRLGQVVSGRLGKSVDRNRMKRVLREAFRACKGELPVGLDIVVMPKKGVQLSVEGVKEDLLTRLPPDDAPSTNR